MLVQEWLAVGHLGQLLPVLPLPLAHVIRGRVGPTEQLYSARRCSPPQPRRVECCAAYVRHFRHVTGALLAHGGSSRHWRFLEVDVQKRVQIGGALEHHGGRMEPKLMGFPFLPLERGTVEKERVVKLGHLVCVAVALPLFLAL